MMKLAKPSCLADTIFSKLKAYRMMLRQTCKVCNGTGVISFDEKEKIVNRCKSCTGKFEEIRKYLEVNLSPRHVEFTLDLVKENFEKQCYEAFNVVIESALSILSHGHIFISQKSLSTTFGVTTMGTILLKSLVDRGFDCCSVSAQEISDCFYNFGDDKDRNDRLRKLLDYYEGVQILMITDFADQFKPAQNSSFRGEKFMDFLLKRKINNRHVIFCSSLHWTVFERMYEKLKLPEHLRTNAVIFELITNNESARTTVNDKLVGIPNIEKLTSYTQTTNHQPPKKKDSVVPVPIEPEPQMPQNEMPLPEQSIEIAKKQTIRRTTDAKKKPR